MDSQRTFVMTVDGNQGMSIRRAAPSDAESVAALTDAAYSEWVPVLGRKPQPMITDYAAIIATHWTTSPR